MLVFILGRKGIKKHEEGLCDAEIFLEEDHLSVMVYPRRIFSRAVAAIIGGFGDLIGFSEIPEEIGGNLFLHGSLLDSMVARIRAAALILHIHKRGVMRTRVNNHMAHFRGIVLIQTAIREKILSVCGKVEGKLILVRVSPTVISSVKESVNGILFPACTHGAMANVRKNGGKIGWLFAFFSIGGNPLEHLVIREESQIGAHFGHHGFIAAIIQIGHMAIRLGDTKNDVYHRAQTLHHGGGKLHAVNTGNVDTFEIQTENAEMISRCQFILEALGINLHVKLGDQAIEDKLLPCLCLLIEGEAACDIHKARQLNDQPVMAGAIVAKVECMLPDGFEDLNDQGIRKKPVPQEYVQRIHPFALHTDTGLNGTPARVTIRIVAVGNVGNREFFLIDPGFDNFLEGTHVPFILRNQIRFSQRQEFRMAVELPNPLAVVIGRAVGFPINLQILELIGITRGGKPAIQHSIGRGKNLLAFFLGKRRFYTGERKIFFIIGGAAHIRGKHLGSPCLVALEIKLFGLGHFGDRKIQASLIKLFIG